MLLRHVLHRLFEAHVIEEVLRLEDLRVLLFDGEFLAPKGVAKIEHHCLEVGVEFASEALVGGFAL